MGKLDGKVAIVTGAARGLGRAYAKRLAGLGAKVAVADLNLRSYEEFEAEAKDMTADSFCRLCADPRKGGSHQTPCWREVDSNHRYPEKGTSCLWAAPIDPKQFAIRNKNRRFATGTMVRIHLPPAASQCEPDRRRLLTAGPTTMKSSRSSLPILP
jgi:hypothetical protein